jgi:hypothetical protein
MRIISIIIVCLMGIWGWGHPSSYLSFRYIDGSLLTDTSRFIYSDSLRRTINHEIEQLASDSVTGVDSLKKAHTIKKLELLESEFLLNKGDIDVLCEYLDKILLTDIQDKTVKMQIDELYSPMRTLALCADSIHDNRKDEPDLDKKFIAWQSSTIQQYQVITNLRELLYKINHNAFDQRSTFVDGIINRTDSVVYDKSESETGKENVLIPLPTNVVTIDTLKKDEVGTHLVIQKASPSDVSTLFIVSQAEENEILNARQSILTDSVSLLSNKNQKDVEIQSNTGDSLSVADDKLTERFISAVYTKDTVQLRDLITGFDKESLKKTWELYQHLKYGEMSNAEITQALKGDAGMAEKDLVMVSDKKYDQVKQKTEGIGISNKAQQTVQSKEFADVAKTESTINNTDQNKDTQALNVKRDEPKSVDEFIQQYAQQEKQNPIDSLTNSQIYFVVQIVACRDQLSKHYLNAIYKGSENVIERREEDWYKYQLAPTNDYRQALKTLKATESKGAFIVAYMNDKKLSLWNVLHQKASDRMVIDGGLGNEPLVFVIQILALKQPASPDELKQYYKGIWPLRIVEEDNWFKYQIVVGPSFKEAKERWKSVGVDGSFIVAYFNGKKIDTKEALEIIKQNKSNK